MARTLGGVARLLSLLAVLLSSVGTLRARAASVPTTVTFTRVATGLTQPDFVTNAGDGSNRLFILQQTGQIRILKNGSLLATPFLNLSGSVGNFTGSNGEQGLLGLAFDPDYAASGIFYITYTTNTGDATFPYTTTLARYHVSGSNADLANSSSGSVLLSIPKKYTNHNGGMLAFGPDGYLYMSMGDGGSGGDPDNNAQNKHSLLGKLLRLDVTGSPPSGQKYIIPSTNPFFGNPDPAVRQEIWAYGLRNPWRFSFDRSTGDLYIGDVGQDTEEEVDFQSAGSAGGQNYGWRILEGNLCYNPASNCVAPAGYVGPVATYDHGTNDSYGCSITGGYVYRGSRFLALQGVYFYGDYCSGRLLGLVRNNGTWSHSLVVDTGYLITSFGEDEQGGLYVADYNGSVYEIGSPQVDVRIGGSLVGSYALPPGSVTRQSYAGVDSGPVVVTSTTGMPIVAAIRDLWSDSTHATSSVQVMGLPAGLLSTSYYFPAYNNVTLDDQIRFGNVGTAPTTVTVKIAGTVRGTYYLLPGTSQRVNYSGVDAGPVVVSSSGGVKIIASIRDSWQTGGEWTSYSQLMGLPATLLSSSYYFPAYNNVSLDDQIRFGNVGTKNTTVTVRIAGVVKGTYVLRPNQSQRVSYTGVDSGPVVVSSSGGVKIIASIRDSWWDGTRWTSYSQLMGLPASQLSTIYHFPVYENVGQLDGQLRFGNVGSSPTWVTVTIGGVNKGSYWLGPSQSQRVSYAGLDSGPVRIESSGGVPIIASLRDSWWDGTVWTSYSQLMGLPNGQLSTSYYFPAYNNVSLDDELRIGVP